MKRLGLAGLLILLLAVSISPFLTQAQDNMMTDKHVCDSTLMTLLLVAEGDYGFHSMQDTSTFEKGQLQPLFDTMMMGMDTMSGDEMMATEEPMMGGDMMATEEPMMGDNMMDTVMLAPGVLPDEDQACTDLRAELESFFYDHWAMMGDSSMSNGG